MSEKPLFASQDVVVGRRTATINGQTFSIAHVTRVGPSTDRRGWQWTLKIGLGLLAASLVLVLFNADCVLGTIGQCEAAGGGPSAVVVVLLLLFAVPIGLACTVRGAILVLYGSVNNRAGNYLEVVLADGRTYKLGNLNSGEISRIQAAFHEAMVCG